MKTWAQLDKNLQLGISSVRKNCTNGNPDPDMDMVYIGMGAKRLFIDYIMFFVASECTHYCVHLKAAAKI